MISKIVDKDFSEYTCIHCKHMWTSRPYRFKVFCPRYSEIIDRMVSRYQHLKCPNCGSRYWYAKEKKDPAKPDFYYIGKRSEKS